MFLQWLTLILVVVATEINLVFVVLGGLLTFFIALVGKGVTDLISGLSYVLLAFVVWRFLLKTGASENTEISYTMRFATLVMVIAVILLLFGEVMCSAANQYIEINQVPFLRNLCEKDLNVQVTDIDEGRFDEGIYGFNFEKTPKEKENPKEVQLGKDYTEFKELDVPLCIKKLFTATKTSDKWVIDWNFEFDREQTNELLESKDSISSWYYKTPPSIYKKTGTIVYLDNLGEKYSTQYQTGKITNSLQSFQNIPVCFKGYKADTKFKTLMVDFNTYFFENKLKRIFTFTGSDSDHKQVRESLKKLLRSQLTQELYELENRSTGQAYGLGNCKGENASECEMTHVICTYIYRSQPWWLGLFGLDSKKEIFYAVFSLF